jgi:hypothetical protein
MAGQSSRVDALTLMILLIRVNQTILQVVLGLLESQAGSSLPVAPLRALSQELKWVGDVVHQQIAASRQSENQSCSEPDDPA